MSRREHEKSNNKIVPETTAAIGRMLLDFLEHDVDPEVKLLLDCPRPAQMDRNSLPALSLYLYNVTPDMEEMGGVRDSRIEKIQGDHGEHYEVARELPIIVRLDYLVTVWGHKVEQEGEMIASVLQALHDNRTLKGSQLEGSAFRGKEELPLLYSGDVDRDLLSSFWSDVGRPRKPTIHLWTSVPLYQSKVVPIKRVKEREIRLYTQNGFPSE